MNTFGLDIEQLDPEEAKEALFGCHIERLPGAPPFLSKKECAAILGVSVKIINYLVDTGALPLTDIPCDSIVSLNLFSAPTEPPTEKCVLRSDLVAFLEKSLLCYKPVLYPEDDR